MRTGCVYLITNLINGKRYVGQTVHTAKHRFKFHCSKKINSAIHNAIKKYGKTNFKVEELVSCFSIDGMNELEEMFIKDLNTLYPNGYNLISGGLNHIRSEELRRQHSQRLKGKIYDSRRKWIKATSLDKKIELIFKGSKAGVEYGFTPGLIRKCLCGQRFKHAGFTFEYINQANQTGSSEIKKTEHGQRLEIEPTEK